MKKTVIIGGGASGMMAALAAAENGAETILLERQSRVGRKLLSTGNGRCNLTNTQPFDGHFHGEEPEFSSFALSSFSPEQSIAYFQSLGLATTEQYGGRVYPMSNSANSVVDVLRYALRAFGVSVLLGFPVTEIIKAEGRFHVKYEGGCVSADSVIIACGGIAGGKLGGVTDGYRLLESFGHTRTPLYPALVPVSVNSEFPRALKGVRVECAVTLKSKNSVSVKSIGELQFTENGVSGPVVFDLSRSAAISGGVLSVDFMPDFSEEQIMDTLRNRKAVLPDLEAGSLAIGLLHNRLAVVVAKAAGVKPSSPAVTLSEWELFKIAEQCKHFSLPVKGVSGFENAQITVGGIRTVDFIPQTMESRLCPGVFACGEVLDVDGDCGGFNLRWAWASGRLAGLYASR